MEDPLPLTAKMLSRVCDVRLPLMWDNANFADMVDVLCESLDAVVGYQDFERVPPRRTRAVADGRAPCQQDPSGVGGSRRWKLTMENVNSPTQVLLYQKNLRKYKIIFFYKIYR